MTDRMVVGSELDPTVKTKIEWSISSGAVALSWASQESVSSWRIKRNGRTLASDLNRHTFIDTDVPSTGVVRYTVEGSAKVKVDGKPQKQPYFLELSLPQFDHSIIGKTYSASAAANLENNSDVGRAQVTREVNLSYRAFIPYNRVNAPLICGNTVLAGIATFGGDNRGWSKSLADQTGKARVQWNATVGTDGWVEFHKIVNPTTGYDKAGKKIGSWQESTNTVTSRLISSTSQEQKHRYQIIDSRNRACATAPGIDSDVVYTLTSAGYHTINGAHDRAPNHEIVAGYTPDIQNGARVQGCPYRRELVGFEQLAPGMPKYAIYVKWAGSAMKPC